MKIKKWLACLLITVQMFSCVVPITTYAQQYTEMEIRVCCDGYMEYQTILESSSGRKFAPLSWLTYYGSMKMKENKDTYEYYYVGEEKNRSFARRIFVDKKDGDFSIKLYQPQLILNPVEYYNWLVSLDKEEWITVLLSGAKNSAEAKDALGKGDDNWMELDSGSFIQIKYDNEIWVPMDQVLALCGVDVDVANGRLYIKHDTLSIWQVLYQYSMGDVLFDMDEEIWGNEGLSVAGYVLDTGLNLKVLRLDFLANSGRVMDYEDLFEGYLSDNAAYLSMFKGGESPISQRQEMYRQYLDDVSTAWDLYEGIIELVDATKIIEVLGENDFDIGGLDLGSELDKTGLVGNITNGLLWLYDYCNTYFNQVDDHREMLLTVYDYQIEKEPYLKKAKEMKNWPSYKAAKNVTEKYNTANINTKTLVKDGIWDLIKDEAPEALVTMFQTMKPWAITTTITKPFLKEDFKTIEDAAMLGFVENTLTIAYDTYVDCKNNGNIHTNRYTKNRYDKEALNTMRLAGIMTLVISKYCYEYENRQRHTKENDEKIAQIQEMLVAYYMAADGLEMDAYGYYGEKRKSLQESLKYLTVIFEEDDEDSEETSGENNDKPDIDSKPENNTNTENADTTSDDSGKEHMITEEEAKSCIISYNWGGFSFPREEGRLSMQATSGIIALENAPYEVESARVVSITMDGRDVEFYQTSDPDKMFAIASEYVEDPESYLENHLGFYLVCDDAIITDEAPYKDDNDIVWNCRFIRTIEVTFKNGQKVMVDFEQDRIYGGGGGPITYPEDYL